MSSGWGLARGASGSGLGLELSFVFSALGT